MERAISEISRIECVRMTVETIDRNEIRGRRSFPLQVSTLWLRVLESTVRLEPAFRRSRAMIGFRLRGLRGAPWGRWSHGYT
jgi:hypothetical protein